MQAKLSNYRRLEPFPNERNLAAGFAARIHDPLWFLARQWEMGEFQGENASSPVLADYTLKSEPIFAADPRFDPTQVPAEAIVESEVDDWWTMGRRLRVGKAVVAAMEAAGMVAPPPEARPRGVDLRFRKPSPPYEHFEAAWDGLALWHLRDDLAIAHFFPAEIPPHAKPAWSSARLLYDQDADQAFIAGNHRLAVRDHAGGRLDWYAVAASAMEGAEPPVPATERVTRQAIPAALQYPGAPHSRWWQIEASAVDFGGFAPDSAHTPTALLTELIFSHSDDWFHFPVLAQAGRVVLIEGLTIHDAFGRTYDSSTRDEVAPEKAKWQGLQPPEGWTLFASDGDAGGQAGGDAGALPGNALVLWHVAETPLESAPVERVQFGLDEESNLLWAVERVVDGREVASRPPQDELNEESNPRLNRGAPSGNGVAARTYAYLPSEGVLPFWHPYTLEERDDAGIPLETRRLVQRRLVDYSRVNPQPMPAPVAQILQPIEDGTLHRLLPLAIPSSGVEVERRWQLARDMLGRPVLWMQRQRRQMLASPARRLRFDVMEELRTQE